MAERLGKVVNDEALRLAEALATYDVNLPAGDVGVKAVEKGRVVVDLRQVVEEVCVLE